MADTHRMTPNDIRAAQSEWPKLRERDLATKLGISEAELVAAFAGHGATRISAHPDAVMPVAERLGEVMALTRLEGAVHEKVGLYQNYHPGQHAAMVLSEEIDLRIFLSHWVHGFMVEKPTEGATRRSIQVFDAAGDAVHKIFLRDNSITEEWDTLRADLAVPDQSSLLDLAARRAPEAPKSNLEKRDVLLAEWEKLTDTHQFLRLCSKLKMNRLGAYRIATAPWVRALSTEAVDEMLHKVRDAGIEIMLFVGNRGCLQIHTGPIQTLHPMGPWQNIMDPGFNLHLRLDKIAEVWAVTKPTHRGPAVSVEAFDADGVLIFQMFGVSKEGRDSRPVWDPLVAALPGLEDA